MTMNFHVPRWLQWITISVAVLIGAVLIAASFADEPLRRYAEQSTNEAMEGYSIHIGTLDLHPLNLSVELRDVIVRQKAGPESPLAQVPHLVLDAEFVPLLAGKAVVDVSLNDPVLSVTRQLLETASAKTTDETVQKEHIAWQDRLREMVPFQTNVFIKNGEVSYTGPPTVEPIRVTLLDVVVRNVTNRPPQGPAYPAEVRIASQISDRAELEVSGRADPLMKPFPAAQFAVRLSQLEIGKILAAVGQTDLPIKSGTIMLAGHLEVGPAERSVTIDRLHLHRPHVEHVNQQTDSSSNAADGGIAAQIPVWQEQALALFPIYIREATIEDGTVTYRHAPTAEPVQLRAVTASLQDVRNVTSKTGEHPTRMQARVRLGEQGLVELDGRGDLFAKPMPAIETRVRLNQLRLPDVAPLANTYNLRFHDGLVKMDGHVKHDKRTTVALESFLLEHGKVDYVYRPDTVEKQRRQVRHGVRQAARLHQDAAFVFRMEHGKILSSEVGFINQTTQPDYRVYMADLNADMDHFSNRLEEGTGVVKITGKFMGSGPTVMKGTFRPEKPRPDFDLAVTIIRTDVTALNNVLRAYGNVDTHRGRFAMFSELTVKNNRIDGYLKPLFRDVDVYDPQKDQDKALSRQVYKAVVGGVMSILENQPRDEVATKTDVSGRLENPAVSTWQVIATLVQNAFFNAILPGFAGRS